MLIYTKYIANAVLIESAISKGRKEKHLSAVVFMAKPFSAEKYFKIFSPASMASGVFRSVDCKEFGHMGEKRRLLG